MAETHLQDRNFNGLIQHFNRRIYQTSKGRIRLALLMRDLEEILPSLFSPKAPLNILDAGAGEGMLALKLAQAGHKVTLCDYSSQMLDSARQSAQQLGLDDRVQFVEGRIQECFGHDSQFDLVLCHAVLEWVGEPRALVQQLVQLAKPNGLISLMFFNHHSTVFRSLVRGYLDKALNNHFSGNGEGLTPINPLMPDQVIGWLNDADTGILLESGIRVFHDYMHKDVRDRRSESDILQLEMRYSRIEPYRAMGRYYHVVGRSPAIK